MDCPSLWSKVVAEIRRKEIISLKQTLTSNLSREVV